MGGRRSALEALERRSDGRLLSNIMHSGLRMRATPRGVARAVLWIHAM